MTTILVVEDNEDLAFGLQYNLEAEGYAVLVAVDGRKAIELAQARQPDLLVLDINLPGVDGFEVLRSLRSAGSTAPVLVLTARAGETDKVRGLKLGADDYLTKPFGLSELLARIEALLRRTRTSKDPVERFGAVVVDPGTRTVRRHGQLVDLAPMEFDLLLALIRRGGAVASRKDLLREVWGHQARILTRTVDAQRTS
jgi:two-component system, OmpR family, alkaline phosphatase synthesis response regulator PhoP